MGWCFPEKHREKCSTGPGLPWRYFSSLIHLTFDCSPGPPSPGTAATSALPNSVAPRWWFHSQHFVSGCKGDNCSSTQQEEKKVSDAHFLLRCTQLIFTFCSEGKTLKIFNHICGLAPGDGHKSVLIALCINAKRLTVRSPTVKEPLSTWISSAGSAGRSQGTDYDKLFPATQRPSALLFQLCKAH